MERPVPLFSGVLHLMSWMRPKVLHDALCILTATVKEPRIVCGGGCTEVLMAQAIDRQVESTPGKKALAMASFARALRQLPPLWRTTGGMTQRN